tara:strand:+ start:120 stop:410 length:291 start_codon:yes stop_codon:yes gene_type:complete
VDVGSRDTYSKEGKEGVGYDDEIISPYHNPATLSNSVDGCAVEFYVHAVFIDILTSDLFHLIERLLVSKDQTIIFSVKGLMPIEQWHALTGDTGTY